MGAVYSAFDRQLTRIVALKTILPEMGARPALLKRYKQEVLLALGAGAGFFNLGPRTLRAELAPIVALSSLWTRWGW